MKWKGADKMVKEGAIATSHDIARMADYIDSNPEIVKEMDPYQMRKASISKPWRGQHKKGIQALEQLYGPYQEGEWRAWAAGWRWAPSPSRDGKFCSHWFYPPRDSVLALMGRIRSTDMPGVVTSLAERMSQSAQKRRKPQEDSSFNKSI